MELHLPKRIHTFYRSLFPILLVIIGYHNIFNNWQLPLYGFNELEDIGRLLFVCGLSICESALLTVFLWWGVNVLKQIVSKNI